MSVAVQRTGLSLDFRKFWTGQTISNLGSAFTQWAVPLLVFKLTHSPVNLGIATAATFLPYLLFGLPLGAWMDRVDRKRAMVALDSLNAIVILSVPLVATFWDLSVWWIYAVTFIQSTAFIAFSAGEFAAIPSLVGTDDLVTANGRIQATYSAAQVAGPLLAGLLVAFMSIQWVMAFDAASFVISAVSLSLVRASFNVPGEGEAKEPASILADVREGLRYVIGHPVLRNISLMMALINFVGVTVGAQLVLFGKVRLDASDSQVGFLFAAGSLGVVVIGLFAGRIRRRVKFSDAALGAMILHGAFIVGLAATQHYAAALVLWAAASGFGLFLNINTQSLRQAIVPGHLMGRVASIAAVIAWGSIPLGTLAGGAMIAALGQENVGWVYGAIGVLIIMFALFFKAFTALGRAEDYLPAEDEAEAGESEPEPAAAA
jgi:MFS family permease